MRKLEEEPETYDSKFTALTKGINLKVQDWIIDHLNKSESIVEVGCGPGKFATKMALRDNNVIAFDKNPQMITVAMKNFPRDQDVDLLYQIGSFTDWSVEDNSKDLIVSTFMLSELRPLEQQILLRNCWKALKPDGRILLAAEFVPSGFWKRAFKVKRWRYRKKLRRRKFKKAKLLNWFFKYIEPIGFKITDKKKWKHGAIQGLELQKVKVEESDLPGYYQPEHKKFNGFHSQLRIYRCIFSGQIDRVPIEPGIYQSGSPDRTSPIIVTANYEYTYIKVMRSLKYVDAWVICVDSNGINVWCAARGNDFGNEQVTEVVEATDIQNLTEKKTLILPQLSAGGVAIPQLPKKSEKFPFKIVYGPVWSKDLPKFLEERPARKPDSMKLAKFSLKHRIRAGITHTTFLYRKIFLIPLICILALIFSLNIFLGLEWSTNLWWVGEIFLWILITNLIICLLFPLSNFTRCFICKGIFFGIINVIVLGALTWILHNSIWYVLLNLCLFMWIAFFSTMSFSGYTMSTSHREIQATYPIFTTINIILLIASIVLSTLGFIVLNLI